MNPKISSLTPRNVIVLIGIIFFASAVLIVINYYTILITSGVRAYINGESQYSKGQKDASRNLLLYLDTSDTLYFNRFRKELRVNIGDSIVRTGLSTGVDESIVRAGLAAGRNHPDDHDAMIWLFKNFGNISFMKRAIQLWKEADYIILQEYRLAEEAHLKILRGQLTAADKAEYVAKITHFTTGLTIREREFSGVLGAAARTVNHWLFITNVVMTLLIIGSASGYALVMIQRLRENNADLSRTNNELDKFVYSASHDLRAPISSLSGLIEIAMVEDDVNQIKSYLTLMKTTLGKQDEFIREIIDFSRNKRTIVHRKEVNVDTLIDQVIARHQYMPGAHDISIRKEISDPVLWSDGLRLEIVLNNIISNAIKYHDKSKDEKYILIKSYRKSGMHVIEIADNGQGIRKEYHEKIFDMFFVTPNNQKGSGLGLYITKETIARLKGTIRVESEARAGSNFIINIPAA
jgi:signal transduction histidine kinase